MSRRFDLWRALDGAAHRIHLHGPIGRWLCYRFDLACGMTKAEARSGSRLPTRKDSNDSG